MVVRRLLHEALLALDAAEVGARIPLPLAVAELLVVAAAGVGERLHPVELVTAGLRVEAGVLVAGGNQKQTSAPPIASTMSLNPLKSTST